MTDPSQDLERTERQPGSAARPLEVFSGVSIPWGLLEAPQRLLQLEVIGVPRPQGSKRHVGRGILVESCRELKPWRESITAAAIEAGVDRTTGPVWVELIFRFDRPKGHYGAKGLRGSAPEHKTTKPDVDKLARACLDALFPCWGDDAQVVGLLAQKRWCVRAELPGVVIQVWRG